MIYVTTIDGANFHGATATEIVRDMMRRAWFAPSCKVAYMREVADRIAMFNGQMVRHAGARVFLEDLQKAGLIKINRTTN